MKEVIFNPEYLHIVMEILWLCLVIPALAFDTYLIRKYYIQRNRDIVTTTYNCLCAVVMLLVTLWLVNSI